jgi:hypothetical protein
MMLPANVSSVPALSPLATVRSHSVGPSLMRWVHRHPKLRVRAAKRQGFESPRRLQHCTACRDPTWGPYLDARSHVVAELADQVRLNAEAEASAWAAEPNAHMPAELIADVRVWRAATRLIASCNPPGHASSVAPPESSKGKRRPAMAATARHTNPQRYCGLILAGTGRG